MVLVIKKIIALDRFSHCTIVRLFVEGFLLNKEKMKSVQELKKASQDCEKIISDCNDIIRKSRVGIEIKKSESLKKRQKALLVTIKSSVKILASFNDCEDVLASQLATAKNQLKYLKSISYPFPDKHDKKGNIIDQTKSLQNKKVKQIKLIEFITQ